MFLRIVRLRVREGQEAAFTSFYQERVIPALAGTDGCLYAGLLAPWRGEGHQSLTIWESIDRAHAYEDSGLYHRLLAEAAPYLSERTEWRVRLSRDPLETSDPSRREIAAEEYKVEADEGSGALENDGRAPFVRIVDLRVDPDRRDEFVSIYTGEVMPALRAQKGCRGVFLAEGAADLKSMLSITLWNREEDAMRYEMGGEFERLTARLKTTFSPLYDWRVSLGGPAEPGSSGLKVSSYQLVRGRRLDPNDPER
ncbi:MAG: antibiotic biosynthesis monooxygenase [Acidobacteria bacterium]|nr:antibiotic biosynthesis monooxygenase [Acidobacteriota bacterium]MCB9378845.1 antibiotic biosynthesis monooxygenase [Holophagales bacterium]